MFCLDGTEFGLAGAVGDDDIPHFEQLKLRPVEGIMDTVWPHPGSLIRCFRPLPQTSYDMAALLDYGARKIVVEEDTESQITV